MNLDTPVREIKGVGDKTEKSLQNLGVYSLRDMLLHFPRTYKIYPPVSNYENIEDGQIVSVLGVLKTPAALKRTSKMDIVVASVFFEDKYMEVIWYRQPFMLQKLSVNCPLVFYGKITVKNGKYKMEMPEVFLPKEYDAKGPGIIPHPIYSLTKGISNNFLIKTVEIALNNLTPFEECLPADIVKKRQLISLLQAYYYIHKPRCLEDIVVARNRFAYEEFFWYLLRLKSDRIYENKRENTINLQSKKYFDLAMSNLPFELTNGQKSAIDELLVDLEGEYFSQRLIQGDVGSGKTIVAFLAMLLLAENGYQTAIMAPTEVLAKQHAKTFAEWINLFKLPFDVVCLTGSLTKKQKGDIYDRISGNEPLFITGTNALIQEKAIYENLGLVVIDEQHRFGVKQRDQLSKKGDAHTIVMSATPIPRTLSLILFGDMNLSVIKDKPADRLPIKNCVIKESSRKTAYNFINKEISLGHQVYIICPLVEDSEKTEAQSVKEYEKLLRTYIKDDIRILTLHGRMKASEKNEIMDAFANHKADILVSTTVVEVGVNVPNATVIMIENANRFGLAQLHQLRGRVGRGTDQSYCIFMDDTKESEPTPARLEVVNKSNDGFFIANEDMRLRGPGDMYGIRQSGVELFGYADVILDSEQLKAASCDVDLILKEDSSLDKEQNIRLKEYLEHTSSMYFTNL